jgi:hypothetical protein
LARRRSHSLHDIVPPPRFLVPTYRAAVKLMLLGVVVDTHTYPVLLILPRVVAGAW